MDYRFERSTVDKISWIKGEPSWMTALRLKAWDVCEKAMPSMAGVDLKTLVAFLEPPSSSVPSLAWPDDLQEALDERGDEEGLVVQRDTTILSRSISKEQVRKGVIFTDLDTAVKSSPDLVQRYFAQLATPDDPWIALHTAFWSGGSFLYVPPHVDVALPFHACYWTSTSKAALFPHTLIVAEAGSRVSLMDDHISTLPEVSGLSVEVVEIWAREKAQIYYYDRQNIGPTLLHVRNQKTSVARSGQLISFRAEMGGVNSTRQLTLEKLVGDTREFWAAKPLPEHLPDLEKLFDQLPIEPLRDKLRYYIEGKMKGLRPPLSLESIAAWHPEVR